MVDASVLSDAVRAMIERVVRAPEPATPAAPIACFRCGAEPLMLRLVAITVGKETRQEWACPPCDAEGWWR